MPCSLSCDGTTDEDIARFARRILDTFGPRVILNVGDQYPSNTVIDKAVALGRLVQDYAKKN